MAGIFAVVVVASLLLYLRRRKRRKESRYGAQHDNPSADSTPSSSQDGNFPSPSAPSYPNSKVSSHKQARGKHSESEMMTMRSASGESIEAKAVVMTNMAPGPRESPLREQDAVGLQNTFDDGMLNRRGSQVRKGSQNGSPLRALMPSTHISVPGLSLSQDVEGDDLHQIQQRAQQKRFESLDEAYDSMEEPDPDNEKGTRQGMSIPRLVAKAKGGVEKGGAKVAMAGSVIREQIRGVRESGGRYDLTTPADTFEKVAGQKPKHVVSTPEEDRVYHPVEIGSNLDRVSQKLRKLQGKKKKGRKNSSFSGVGDDGFVQDIEAAHAQVAERIRAAEAEIRGGVVEWRRDELLIVISDARAEELALEKAVDERLAQRAGGGRGGGGGGGRGGGGGGDDDEDEVVAGFL